MDLPELSRRYRLEGDHQRLPSDWVTVYIDARSFYGSHPGPIAVTIRVDAPDGAYEASWKLLPQGSRRRLLRLPDQVTRLHLTFDLPAAAKEEVAAPRVSMREIGRLEVLAFVLWQHRRQLNSASLQGKQTSLKAAASRVLAGYRVRRSDAYGDWIKLYDKLDPADATAIQERTTRLPYRPVISLLVPLFEVSQPALQATIASMSAQLYPYWELCFVDSGSTPPWLAGVLNTQAKHDPRIKVATTGTASISAATNLALEMATGDYIALLDQGDVLARHALYAVAEAIAANQNVDLFYSDEDRLDDTGRRRDPFFKPDWNPDFFLSRGYIGRLSVLRTTLVRKLLGFRTGLEGAQEFDLVLRVVDATSAPIVHIPHVLYHRQIAAEVVTAAVRTWRGDATKAAATAIRGFFASKGEEVRVEELGDGLRRIVLPAPDKWPLVTAIVPTRDQFTILKQCVEGLLHETDYPNLEVIIVDNDSREPQTLAYFRQIERLASVRVLSVPGRFNFSRMNNLAAREAHGDILLFLNNDVSVFEGTWLKELILVAIRKDIGAVGARLLYPDDTIQHAGVVLGLGGAAGHVHLGAFRRDAGYFGRLKVQQDVAAVTAACMTVPKAVFELVGGFDEDNLAVAYNDVDLCIKIRNAGYRIIWTPFAELYHFESKSRGSDFALRNFGRYQKELEFLITKWSRELKSDPFFSPNLSLSATTPQLAFPPRVAKAWQCCEMSHRYEQVGVAMTYQASTSR